jgi:hypothetical protein
VADRAISYEVAHTKTRVIPSVIFTPGKREIFSSKIRKQAAQPPVFLFLNILLE